MSKRGVYEKKTEEVLIPITEEYGVSIYDVEYVKEGEDWYLRVYLDKEDGINIIDCENVSRKLSERMDEEDFIEDAYILEVSSPGLGRTLKKQRHFEASLGEEVELRTYKPIQKKKEFSIASNNVSLLISFSFSKMSNAANNSLFILHVLSIFNYILKI